VSLGRFDTGLLNYMRSRTGPKFFYDTRDINSIANFINSNGLDFSDLQAHGDALAEHLFPDQFSSGVYNIQLPAQINWIAPGGSTNPEFLHSMNRQEVVPRAGVDQCHQEQLRSEVRRGNGV
jgi:hypothetical protein